MLGCRADFGLDSSSSSEDSQCNNRQQCTRRGRAGTYSTRIASNMRQGCADVQPNSSCTEVCMLHCKAIKHSSVASLQKYSFCNASSTDTTTKGSTATKQYSNESTYNRNDSAEADENLISLQYLIIQAEIEMQNIIGERISQYMEISKGLNEKKMEIRRRKREVLGEINIAEHMQKPVFEEKEYKHASTETLGSTDDKIECFADFETSMFAYKARNGIKMYICPYEGCTMELPTVSRIKRHYIVHTRLRPFKCLNRDCNKRFSRKDNMLQHYKVHCSYT